MHSIYIILYMPFCTLDVFVQNKNKCTYSPQCDSLSTYYINKIPFASVGGRDLNIFSNSPVNSMTDCMRLSSGFCECTCACVVCVVNAPSEYARLFGGNCRGERERRRRRRPHDKFDQKVTQNCNLAIRRTLRLYYEMKYDLRGFVSLAQVIPIKLGAVLVRYRVFQSQNFYDNAAIGRA